MKHYSWKITYGNQNHYCIKSLIENSPLPRLYYMNITSNCCHYWLFRKIDLGLTASKGARYTLWKPWYMKSYLFFSSLGQLLNLSLSPHFPNNNLNGYSKIDSHSIHFPDN